MVRKVDDGFDIHCRPAQEILTSKFELKRVCAGWVPRLLMSEQKRIMIQFYRVLTSQNGKEGVEF